MPPPGERGLTPLSDPLHLARLKTLGRGEERERGMSQTPAVIAISLALVTLAALSGDYRDIIEPSSDVQN